MCRRADSTIVFAFVCSYFFQYKYNFVNLENVQNRITPIIILLFAFVFYEVDYNVALI